MNGNNLHPLQRDIVLTLAKVGPLTINQISKSLKKGYKAVWVSLGSLEQKKIVKPGKERKWLGRAFPLYWLTWEGVMEALCLQADSDLLFRHACSVEQPDEESLEYLKMMIDFTKAAGPELLREIYVMFKATEDGHLILRSIPINNERLMEAVESTILVNPKMREFLKEVLSGFLSELNKNQGSLRKIKKLKRMKNKL